MKELEEYVMENVNKLGIGMMGFGGEMILFGCKVGVINCIFVSFYVLVVYNCWVYCCLGIKINVDIGSV